MSWVYVGDRLVSGHKILGELSEILDFSHFGSLFGAKTSVKNAKIREHSFDRF